MNGTAVRHWHRRLAVSVWLICSVHCSPNVQDRSVESVPVHGCGHKRPGWTSKRACRGLLTPGRPSKRDLYSLCLSQYSLCEMDSRLMSTCREMYLLQTTANCPSPILAHTPSRAPDSDYGAGRSTRRTDRVVSLVWARLCRWCKATTQCCAHKQNLLAQTASSNPLALAQMSFTGRLGCSDSHRRGLGPVSNLSSAVADSLCVSVVRVGE